MRWKGAIVFLGIAGICGLLGAMGFSYLADKTTGEKNLAAPESSPELIARGKYLAKLGDCAACHSVPGRPPFSGGLRMAIPIGAIYTTNITPDSVNGIGRFSLADFDRALRFGVADGHSLYQASNDPTIARGAYFVEGLGHCGECHTPRNLVLQVKAQTPSQGSAFLSGAVIENYFAPSLRNGGPDTLGGWSESEIVDFLTTGANPRGIVFGSMTDVIVHSTQFMSHEDAIATARYLKTLGAPDGQPAKSFVYDEGEHRALKHGDASKPGALLYLDNCAACHRPDGTGYDRVFPRLAGNPVVEAENPISLVSIVLAGSQTPRTAQTPAQFAMPAFAWRLSDRDVADLVNFIRSSWGNSASIAGADDVAGVRRAVAPSAAR
jgi:alcohol dehydrogenase (quinone), cytochrome c subunit